MPSPCRSVYQISFPVKSGSMTGAVPGKLLRIPVQFAAHMGTDKIHLAELSFFCFIHPGFSLWVSATAPCPRKSSAAVSPGK